MIPINENMLMRPAGPLSDGLVKLAAIIAPGAVIAEIGSYLGESARIFLDAGARLVFCIDPWKDGYDDGDVASARDNLAQVEKEFDRRMANRLNWIKLKMSGDEAANILNDRLLDAVYIDAKHTFEAVRANVRTWRSKVKAGGFIAGHDWPMQAVQRAVIAELGASIETFEDGSWLKRM